MKSTGRTEDAAVPILKQAFWNKGTTLTGKVTRRFETAPEPGKKAMCFELALSKLLSVDGSYLSSPEKLTGLQKLNKIGVGEMTGLMMAVNAAGLAHLQPGDIVDITCTGSTDVGKGNPRTDFTITVDRDDKQEKF